jgi:hypothetical protein
LPAYITDEGEVTDEDEGAESEKKKNNKKVRKLLQ